MATPLQDEWMRRVLGANLGEDTFAELDVRGLTNRLRILRDDAVLHGAAPTFADDLRDAVGRLKVGDATVEALVDVLEQRMAEVARSAHARQAEQTVAAAKTGGGVGVVEFGKLRLRLEAARGKFGQAVDNLKASFQALLATPDFVDDPRSSDPYTLAAIASLDQKVPSFPDLAGEIEDAIDRMASSSDTQQRLTHAQAALDAIERFKAKVTTDPLLNMMESTDAGEFPIAALMVGSLEDVAAALRS